MSSADRSCGPTARMTACSGAGQAVSSRSLPSRWRQHTWSSGAPARRYPASLQPCATSASIARRVAWARRPRRAVIWRSAVRVSSTSMVRSASRGGVRPSSLGRAGEAAPRRGRPHQRRHLRQQGRRDRAGPEGRRPEGAGRLDGGVSRRERSWSRPTTSFRREGGSSRQRSAARPPRSRRAPSGPTRQASQPPHPPWRRGPSQRRADEPRPKPAGARRLVPPRRAAVAQGDLR